LYVRADFSTFNVQIKQRADVEYLTRTRANDARDDYGSQQQEGEYSDAEVDRHQSPVERIETLHCTASLALPPFFLLKPPSDHL